MYRKAFMSRFSQKEDFTRVSPALAGHSARKQPLLILCSRRCGNDPDNIFVAVNAMHSQIPSCRREASSDGRASDAAARWLHTTAGLLEKTTQEKRSSSQIIRSWPHATFICVFLSCGKQALVIKLKLSLLFFPSTSKNITNNNLLEPEHVWYLADPKANRSKEPAKWTMQIIQYMHLQKSRCPLILQLDNQFLHPSKVIIIKQQFWPLNVFAFKKWNQLFS